VGFRAHGLVGFDRIGYGLKFAFLIGSFGAAHQRIGTLDQQRMPNASLEKQKKPEPVDRPNRRPCSPLQKAKGAWTQSRAMLKAVNVLEQKSPDTGCHIEIAHLLNPTHRYLACSPPALDPLNPT
jgi:gentisate 1,2-dioxygenase